MSTFNKLIFVKLPSILFLVIAGAWMSSCSSYKQNIMFRTSDDSKISKEKKIAESNYIIQKNDVLTLEVFSNEGEKLIDPNSEAFKDSPQQSENVTKEPLQYVVDKDGMVKLPGGAPINLVGLTMRQAEDLIQTEFEKSYKGAFVSLKVINRRVTVLGSPGGKVIPLVNENIKLTEVLALAGGISTDGKAANIRVLRGDKIFVADFSTVEGYLQDDMLILSGDIIYVEPVRRPFLEALQSYGPIISILTGVATVVIILTRN